MNTLQMVMDLQKSWDTIKECNKVLKDGSHIYFLKKLKLEFEREKERYLEKEKKLDQIKEEMLHICIEKKAVRDNISELGKKLTVISSKEEEKLKLKISEYNGELKRLEKYSSELFEAQEKFGIEKEESRENLVNLKNNFQSFKDSSNSKIIKAQKELEKARNTMRTLEKLLPKTIVEEIQVLNKYKDTAIAQICSNNLCSCCLGKISSTTLDKIYRRKSIEHCEHCGRILYYRHVHTLKPAK